MMAFVWLPWTDPATAFNGDTIAGAVALAALIAVQAALAPGRRLVGPIILLILHVGLLAVKPLAAGVPDLQEFLGLTALFALLLGLLRCAFVIVFHGLFHFLHRDLPKIALDVIQALVYLLALVIVLAAAGVEPLSLLTGSAVATAVLGLALRDTLGNLFAGIALQAQRPFEVGDWIQFDDQQAHVGRVVEINWRATTVVTLDEVEVIVPNGALGTGRITNFTKPRTLSRRSVYVNAPYDVPPRRVHEIILAAIADAWGVLRDPPPSVVTNKFDERGVEYWVRFFTVEFGSRDRVDGGVRDCVWYALQRAGVAIPGPLRTVTLRPLPTATDDDVPADARWKALRVLPLFADLSDDEIGRLATLSQIRLYAPHEVIVRQGDPGGELFVVLRGRVDVSAGRGGTNAIDVNALGPGEIFGEMALMTGARRAATVTTAEECELLAIGPGDFRRLLGASPDLSQRIHRLATERKTQLTDRLDDAATRGADPGDQRHFFVRFMDQLLAKPSD
jgi:small-conductance mechanosensitive channel/CRP-like cAMP-binding protein